MEKTITISTIIKAVIGIIFAIFFVVLLSQYISIAQLNAKNERLSAELASKSQQFDDLNNEKDAISENGEYKDTYIEDYVREHYQYGYEDETLFNS